MALNSSTLTFLILGADGQVGAALTAYLDSREIPYRAIATADALDPEKLRTILAAPANERFVANLLFEEPEHFSQSIDDTWQAAAALIAEDCGKDDDRQLLQLSSGRVFSGFSARGYHESDEPDAVSEVGQSFIRLEQQTMARCPDAVLLRVDWLFSESRNNFLNRLVDAAIHKEELCISTSMRGCPTDAHTVARVLVAMSEQIDCGVSKPDLSGVYHYADSDACSLYTFAKTVITVVKSMSEVRVETIGEVDTRPLVDGERQSENHELNCRKILSTFGIKQRPWRRSLQEVLKHRLSQSPVE
ncbi:sugar nucleotide-binding protein [Reinekea blandensis]|uniref:dTDP-4-dehydrorhamnose reductase n=1 Tax=Reinekea blandensis MED297 TaxID=314283 RepID=A4BEE5_9GAMM|nr:sugar nucleotide-binding protein [Reinekea blandensis]EAR09623.1 dTDP-4-dehydrorhamnose reductase [Reinekea blandensis MED297]